MLWVIPMVMKKFLLIAIKSSVEDEIKVLNSSSDNSRGLNLQGDEKQGRVKIFMFTLTGAWSEMTIE